MNYDLEKNLFKIVIDFFHSQEKNKNSESLLSFIALNSNIHIVNLSCKVDKNESGYTISLKSPVFNQLLLFEVYGMQLVVFHS